MQVVIAYVTPEERRERIYVCDAIRLRDDMLECYHVAKIRYFALTGVNGGVKTGHGAEQKSATLARA